MNQSKPSPAKRHMTCAAAAALLTCFISPAAADGFEYSQAASVRVSDGVIFGVKDAETYLQFCGGRCKIAGYWMPAKEDVARFDADFMSYLATWHDPRAKWVRKMHDEDGYLKQYLGYIGKDGRRHIYVNGFCKTYEFEPPPGMPTRFIIVDDGGECYFQANYDPVKHVINRLSVNGRA